MKHFSHFLANKFRWYCFTAAGARLFWSFYLVVFVLAKKGEHKESFLNHDNKIREYVSRKHVPNEKCFNSFFSTFHIYVFFFCSFFSHLFRFNAFVSANIFFSRFYSFLSLCSFRSIEISSKAIAIGVIEKTE